ncbi:MAG: hypothetical protein KA534_04755 [Sediminibacterium sp.]|nr:hypothetical protein [Sediminibacterium sp.]MBP6144818.1 hypothetical protein [Sediminibacterium sp.]
MKIKSILFFLMWMFAAMFSIAQTGIGTTTPDASAKLEVSATNKGFLPPRVTLTSGTDNTTIANPATGLLVYNTGNNAGLVAGYYYWNGTSWATIATASGSGVSASILRGSRSSGQTTGIAAGGTVVFTQVDNVAGQEMSLNTSTGQITLAAGRTYRLLAQVPNFQTSNSDSRPQLAWYNETTGAFFGSASASYSAGSTAGWGATGGLSEAIITTNVPTVVSYRIVAPFNVSQLGGSGDFSLTGSYPWFEAQVISGNTAVNGQSVDYVSVMLTTDQSNSTAGQNVKFQTIQSGNIPYDANTGNFSLTAGKTYRLTALASLNGTSPAASALDIIWRTADGVNIGPLGSLISSSSNINFSGQGVIDFIYTPTRNITVSLYISFVGNATTVLRAYATNAIITQIGSSAIVNPWTLSGNDTYNTLGKVGIGNNSPTQALDVTGNANVSGKITLGDPSGNVVVKAAGFVNAGIPVTLGDVQVIMSTGGSRSLQIKTTGTNFNAIVSAYTTYNGATGTNAFTHFSDYTQVVSSSYGYIGTSWSFGQDGDVANYFVRDSTNLRFWRITLMVGPGYNNNFISIERLL